jgi:hypothetical protein
MSLDVLLEPIPERSVKKLERCKAGRLVADLPDDMRSQVIELMARPFIDGGLTDEAWQERFKRAGMSVSATIINRHRKGLCCCA